MSRSILIVDDSLTVRMDLAGAFEAAGLPCVACASIEEARRELAREPAGLVILDVLLPDGDGVTFLAELKAHSAGDRPLVVLLTTEAEVADRLRGISGGADEYVGKPYDTSHVVARALEMLESDARNSVRATPLLLLIDDSETVRDEMKHRLEQEGYQVVLARTGEEGLRLAGACRPDGVIVDGHLPGISGPAVIHKLREDDALRRTPCILMTGSAEFASELAALEAGADAYIHKTEPVDVLLMRLSLNVHRGGGPGGAERSVNAPKKALAVDDSPTYLHELGDRLREDGFDVILAPSGQEALALLAAQPVDCILLDLEMPGLSGRDTCRLIKANPSRRDIPVVILTAHDDRQAMVDGIDAGADDYISKSTSFEVVKARVRAQLRRRQYEEENRRMLGVLHQKAVEAEQARAALALSETRERLLSELKVKNEELEAFAHSVSHDLRSPLRHVQSFLGLLAEQAGTTLDATSRDYLENVVSAASRMDQMIVDLLEFSRLGRSPLRRERVDLAALARSVLADLCADCGSRRVEWSVGALPAVHVDGSLLRLVLVNLLSNAFKYTRERDLARVDIASRGSDDGEVVVEVKDNGAGFDMRAAGKLFGVFQRLHPARRFEGTGVGLANVRRIVERHGGRAWALGEPDRGASFFFSLPADCRAPDTLEDGLAGAHALLPAAGPPVASKTGGQERKKTARTAASREEPGES